MLRQPWSMLDDDGTAVALPSPKVPESQIPVNGQWGGNRMTRRVFLQGALMSAMAGRTGARGDQKVEVKPTPQQLAWQEAELTMFFHFGMNTFTDREWGDGTEDPRLFNPTELDARQWAHVARDT